MYGKCFHRQYVRNVEVEKSSKKAVLSQRLPRDARLRAIHVLLY